VRQRHDLAGAAAYKYRMMRAFVRYYLHYTPEVLEQMSLEELAEAWSDLLFVREQMTKTN